MRHETKYLPDRFDGFPVAKDRSLGSRTKEGRSAGEVRASRDHQRDPVCHSKRLYVAGVAPRFSAVSHCVPLLSLVAAGWHLETNPCQAARAGAETSGQEAETIGCDSRQPECQDNRTRRAAGLRRGEKKSPGANDTSSLTLSDLCGRWSSHRPMCKTGTAVAWHWKRSASVSSFPRSSGPTERIDPWSIGPGCGGCGSSKSYPGLVADSRFNPIVGLSNGLSVGSTAHAGLPNPTSKHPKVTRHSFKWP